MRTVLASLALLLAAGCSAAAQPARESLAERVQRLEDESEIRTLLVRYGERLDARDYSGYAALFAKDGTATTGFGSATGPAAIEALLTHSMGPAPAGFVNRERFHLMTTAVVHVSGDRATARSRYTVFERGPDGRPRTVHSGRYRDVLVREADGWKLHTRVSYGVIPYRGPPPAVR